MEIAAIKKAGRCLREARTHLGELRSLQTSPLAEQFEREWRRFLNAIQSVAESLTTGARTNPRSRQWMGAKNKLIRRDPLLSYLLHSRSVGFHGTQRLTLQHISPGTYIEADFDPHALLDEAEDGTWDVPPEVTSVRLWYDLLPVVNEKYRVTSMRPMEHLGTPLSDISAAGLAERAIEFYQGLLSEAATRPWSTSAGSAEHA